MPDIADKGLVRPQEEMQRFLRPEGTAFENVADRRIGGHAKRLGLQQVADMVGAVGALRVLATPVGRRYEVHPNPQGAGVERQSVVSGTRVTDVHISVVARS